MNVEQAQQIVPAKVDSVWDPKSKAYKQVYCPGSSNPFCNWLSEEQYINLAIAEKRRRNQ